MDQPINEREFQKWIYNQGRCLIGEQATFFTSLILTGDRKRLEDYYLKSKRVLYGEKP